MKKKVFILLPLLLSFGSLVGCKSGDTPKEKTLVNIEVFPATQSYSVGYEFTADDIGSFQAYYSDGSTTSIKSGYTSTPTLPYTFTLDDVTNGKDFSFTYETKNASFHVDVIDTKQEYNVSLSCQPESGGTVTGAGKYMCGRPVTVTATENTGFKFVGWYEGLVIKSSEKQYQFTMPCDNVTLSARFNQQ